MIVPVPPYQEFCPEKGILKNSDQCTDHGSAHYDILEWQSVDDKGVNIVCLHALGLSAQAFSDMGSQLAKLGYHSYSLDLRGFGKRRGKAGYKRVNFNHCIRDIEYFLKYLKQTSLDRKTVLVGESMGGAIAIKVAGMFPHLLDGVISSAPAWRLFNLSTITAMGLVDRVTGQPGYATDWVVERATTCEDLRNYWREGASGTRLTLSIGEAHSYLLLMNNTPKNAAKVTDLPALIVQGLHDQLSKPWAAAGVYRHLSTSFKQFLIAAHSEHVVLEENQLTSEMVQFLDDWIAKQVLQKSEDNGFEPVIVMGAKDSPLFDCMKVEKLVKMSGIDSEWQDRVIGNFANRSPYTDVLDL